MKTTHLTICWEALFWCIQNSLFLLLYFLLSSLLCPLGADAEETGVGTSHTQTSESVEFLLFLSDHAGLVLLAHLEQKFSRSVKQVNKRQKITRNDINRTLRYTTRFYTLK